MASITFFSDDAAVPLIEVAQLRKVFRRPDKGPGLAGSVRHLVERKFVDKVAVDDIDLRIDAGEAVAYVGPNGAGKSTTVKMLTGVLVPTSGTVHVEGRVPHKDRIANARRIGVVFGQRTQLWWDLPVRDSLELLRDMHGLSDAEYGRNLERLDATLGLAELLPSMARKLSLGQRMRADLAAALIHRPPIVFLDEPTIGLDIAVKDKVRAFARELVAEGTTVLLTTHDLGDIEDICRRIVIIDAGRIVYDGGIAAVLAEYARERTMHFALAQAPTSLAPIGARLPDAVVERGSERVAGRRDVRPVAGERGPGARRRCRARWRWSTSGSTSPPSRTSCGGCTRASCATRRAKDRTHRRDRGRPRPAAAPAGAGGDAREPLDGAHRVPQPRDAPGELPVRAARHGVRRAVDALPVAGGPRERAGARLRLAAHEGLPAAHLRRGLARLQLCRLPDGGAHP